MAKDSAICFGAADRARFQPAKPFESTIRCAPAQVIVGESMDRRTALMNAAGETPWTSRGKRDRPNTSVRRYDRRFRRVEWASSLPQEEVARTTACFVQRLLSIKGQALTHRGFSYRSMNLQAPSLKCSYRAHATHAAATEAAFCCARRVTLVGSRTPASIRLNTVQDQSRFHPTCNDQCSIGQ
jgi:hypothetical protein